MPEVIKIEGGHRLNGTVRMSGAKNATVALIPAAILAEGPVTIFGVPDIDDVSTLVALLNELNADVKKVKDHLVIDPTDLKNITLDSENVGKLRGSYYFMGALLGKYSRVRIKIPGGCDFGPRPIDLHIKGFEALGARISYSDGIYDIEAEELIGNKIYLDFASVGATINIMLAAVKAKGKTVIENAAKEPETIDVANLLTKMGARIRGAGTDTITIDGVDRLYGTFHEIIPDRVEAGTYLIMAAAIGNRVVIENVITQHLDALISKLEEIGVVMEVVNDSVIVYGGNELFKPVNIKTQTYPGFPTDLQQPITTLLTQVHGQSSIKETLYKDRFGHCKELNKMGATINVDAPQAYVQGKTPLKGGQVQATDLRCGAALILAGLIAEGVTEISNINYIDRGYDDIDNKLKNLGAKIWREQFDD